MGVLSTVQNAIASFFPVINAKKIEPIYQEVGQTATIGSINIPEAKQASDVSLAEPQTATIVDMDKLSKESSIEESIYSEPKPGIKPIPDEGIYSSISEITAKKEEISDTLKEEGNYAKLDIERKDSLKEENIYDQLQRKTSDYEEAFQKEREYQSLDADHRLYDKKETETKKVDSKEPIYMEMKSQGPIYEDSIESTYTNVGGPIYEEIDEHDSPVYEILKGGGKKEIDPNIDPKEPKPEVEAKNEPIHQTLDSVKEQINAQKPKTDQKETTTEEYVASKPAVNINKADYSDGFISTIVSAIKSFASGIANIFKSGGSYDVESIASYTGDTTPDEASKDEVKPKNHEQSKTAEQHVTKDGFSIPLEKSKDEEKPITAPLTQKVSKKDPETMNVRTETLQEETKIQTPTPGRDANRADEGRSM